MVQQFAKPHNLRPLPDKLNKIIKAAEQQWLEQHLLSAFPFKVADYHKFMTVTLEPGESVPVHHHSHHTVLYYPGNAGPVIITPRMGTLIYLPPLTDHEVPAVTEQRHSVAMLVTDAS